RGKNTDKHILLVAKSEATPPCSSARAGRLMPLETLDLGMARYDNRVDSRTVSGRGAIMRPAEAEGDTNQSSRRHQWAAGHIDGRTQALLDRDARVFLRQSVSTPCLSAVRRAAGIWIEDWHDRRYMDFHGNSVHHVGYGHPRLLEALRRQMEELPFAPRRFT